MSIFKCKICGGSLEYKEGSSVALCEYCGTKQTLPKTADEHNSTLYERAEHFRRSNDFDKAINIYEQILNKDNTDAEAYWSLVLCRYGVEYVEDPKSNQRIATVNRMQYTSVLADEDYKSAIKYATSEQKEIYEAEAREIDSIQKGILAISQKEEPFDVFICYKETDNNGRRTPDSVLANELYHQLDNEGYKVFFSRITLEDKLGSAYEPYIFAALNSAKVMVVIGTKPEYFNAVWVRNEWSRFLSLIKNGANKVLIPAYRDMDPYNLPEEFSHLQAQDMSKLGFMQDLIRGIEKIVSVSKPKQAKEQPTTTNSNTAPLLRRAYIFLEDGDFTSADEYCEKVLDLDPENGEAYLGKLMVDLKIRHREKLGELSAPFDSNPQYKKAIRFGNEKLKAELEGYNNAIIQRAEHDRLLEIYKKAEFLLANAKTEANFKEAAKTFESLGDFKDADQKIEYCNQKIEQINSSLSAAGLERQAKAEERAEAFKQKLPLIKKVSFIVVPILVVAIVAVTVIPKIDWSKPTVSENSTSVVLGQNESKVETNTSVPTSSEIVSSGTVSNSTVSKKPQTTPKPSNPTLSTGDMTSDVFWCEILSDGTVSVRGLINENTTSITIPSTIGGHKVTRIDDYAFSECKSLKSVTLPNTITYIGSNAFRETGITSINIPKGVKSIDSTTFCECKSLQSVTIPNTVTSIGAGAFWGCAALKSITIPGSVKTIEGLAFADCSALTSVNFQYGLKSIGEFAFVNCKSLQSITIPDSVTSIGDHAFSDCESITSVVIGKGITTISSGCFADTFSLKSVRLPLSVKTVKDYGFWSHDALDIWYEGTEADKEKIVFDEHNFSNNVTWHYNS